MASNVTLFVTTNTAGSTQSNINPVNIVPNSPNTDYILIQFTEKQNCNNVITALFQNITTNCDLSQINIVSADTSDLVNGVINWIKTGRYTADIYYQSSDSNLDPLLATFAYNTCLDVSSNTSCSGGDFDCDDLDNCPNFNAKLNDVAVDGVTITGDGTVGNPLVAVTGGSGDMTKAEYDPQAINGDAFDQDNMTDGVTNKNYTVTEQTKLSGIESGAEVNNISDVNATDLTDGGDSTLHFHSSDRDRANHTGTQPISSVDNLQDSLNDKVNLNGANLPSSLHSVQRNGYGHELSSGYYSFGKFNGSPNSYFRSIEEVGTLYTYFETDGTLLPLSRNDLSQNVSPSGTPLSFVLLKSIQPEKLEISTASASLTSANLNNQFIDYTGSGGNITIESSYLNVDQEACISQGGSDQFTLVAGAGVTLQSPDGLLTSRVQFSSVGIYKINSTTYRITGDLS